MHAHRNRFLLPLLALVLTLPLSALPAPELDPLAADIEAFSRAEHPAAAESRRLAHLLGLATEFYAGRHEKADAAGLERLEELRQKLSEAGRGVSSRSASTVEGLTGEPGTLAGRVLDNQGLPEAGARIEVYFNGYFGGITYTDSQGNYSLALEPGAYHVYVVPSNFYLSPQLYRELNCRLYLCDLSLATLVDITSGGNRVVNFNLVQQGSIEGQVLRHEDLSPVPGGQVGVFDSQGNLIYSVAFSNGRYQIGGLDPGQYYVASFNGSDRIGHLYRDTICPMNVFQYQLSCPRNQGTLVSVSVNSTTTGIDLQPHRGAALEGRITRRGSAFPQPLYATVYLFGPAFSWQSTVQSDPSGYYRFEGQPAGRYYLYADSYGSTPQFYKQVDCPRDPFCQDRATPVDVVLGELKSGIDFELNGVGTLTGQVRDQRTGAPIANAQLSLTAKGTLYPWAFATTDSAGFYSFSNLPAFEYSLLAAHPHYVDEYFDDVDARLGLESAATVKVLPEQVLTGRDFQLVQAGGISAKLTAAESGRGLDSCRLELIPADRPSPPIYLSCQADGTVYSDQIDPGSYYLIAVEFTDRASLLYGRGSCNRNSWTGTCNTAGGTPIQIRSGEISGLFDLKLEPSAKIQLNLFLNGLVFPTGNIRLFDEDGELYTRSIYGSLVADFLQLKAGSYRLVIEGGPNWESKTWNGVPCNRWHCDPQKSQVITLEAGQFVQVSTSLLALAPYAGCVPDDSSLCLNQGRFRVKAFWKNFSGQNGAGIARTLTSETGYFYFFSPSNLEVMVKALNGCEQRLGQRFWIFAAGLTNVGVELEVEDTLTGTKKRYSNALAQTFQPILDIDAFASCNADESSIASVSEAAMGDLPSLNTASSGQNESVAENAPAPLGTLCQFSNSTEICLAGKFKVTANWLTPDGQYGQGFGSNITDDTAGMSFFSDSNVELVVKILDACQTNLPGYWVFASGLTDVEANLRIENLENGQVQIYHQEPGPFQPILDLNTFSCN